MPPNNVIFNGNSLQSAFIITQDVDHESAASLQANSYPLANSNRSVIPYEVYTSKMIVITGVVTGTTSANLDANLDTFRSYLIGLNKNLDINYNGSTRRYVGSCTATKTVRNRGLTRANFSITFTATQPFGVDTASTTAINTTANTAIPYQPTYTFLGSAPLQYPVITVTFSAMAGNAAAQHVQVSNNATSQTIDVYRVWAATDVLEIDTFNKTVKVNTADVAFTGAFPEFAAGAATFGYNDGFTSRTFAFLATYFVRYL